MQNAKVMAKKLISTERVTENSTSVSCNHPNFYLVDCKILAFELTNPIFGPMKNCVATL